METEPSILRSGILRSGIWSTGKPNLPLSPFSPTRSWQGSQFWRPFPNSLVRPPQPTSSCLPWRIDRAPAWGSHCPLTWGFHAYGEWDNLRTSLLLEHSHTEWIPSSSVYSFQSMNEFAWPSEHRLKSPSPAWGTAWELKTGHSSGIPSCTRSLYIGPGAGVQHHCQKEACRLDEEAKSWVGDNV